LGPLSFGQWRIVTYVLVVSALELRTPVSLVVPIKPGDLSVHLRRRTVNLDFDGVGFHHKKIVRAIAQHIPDATTSGISCL
jgi:hypothetical protein